MSRRVIWYLSLFVVALIGSGTYWYGASFESAIVEPERITRPQTDHRTYQRTTLDNGMQVLAISDPNTSMAAVALQIDAGSWHDPVALPGLAHLASQVLFLKGDTLIKPNPFAQQVQRLGGSLQTQVSGPGTQFVFDVKASGLKDSLATLAAALIQPSWTALDMNRTVNRIEVTFVANQQSDAKKRQDAFQTTLNQAHPAARFAEGNRASLQALDLELQLRRYFQDHYTPDNMKLVVLGSQTTDQLLSLIESLMGDLRGEAQPSTVFPDYYSSNQLPAYLQIKPSHAQYRRLTFSFPVTDPQGADRFMHHWLQQGHTGSLKALLLGKGWITDLSSRLVNGQTSAATFEIQLDLTRAGEQAIQAMGTWVFDSLQLLAQQGVPPWQLTEFNNNEQRRFTYLPPKGPRQTVAEAVASLGRFIEQDTLVGPVYSPNLSAIAIGNFLKHFKADRLMLSLESPDAATSDQTAFYRADFDLSPLPFDWVQGWSAAAIDPLLLPATANRFVPNSMQQNPPEHNDSQLYEFLPDVRLQTPGMTYYYVNNQAYNSPRTSVHFSLASPWYSQNTANQAATRLYLALVQHALSGVTQQASAAGIDLGLKLTQTGIVVQAVGFQASLGIVTSILADTLAAIDINGTDINRVRRALIQQLQAGRTTQVSARLAEHLDQLLIANRPSTSELIQALSQVAASDLQAVQQQVQSGSYMTLMLVGNTLPSEADAIARRLQDSFAPEPNKPGELQVAKLDRTTAHWPLPGDANTSGLLMYFQGETDSYREQALYGLMERLMADAFINSLRDTKQVASALSVNSQILGKLPGMTLYLESAQTDPGLMLLHVDKFLSEYLQTLTAMSTAQFEAYRDGLIAQLSQPHTSLSSQANSWWRDLIQQVPHLNADKRLALEMEKISQTGFIRFYQNQILNPDARRLVLNLASTDHQEAVNNNYQMQPGDRVISGSKQYLSQRPVYRY